MNEAPSILITTHAHMHWVGRCGQWSPVDWRQAIMYLRTVVENARMASEIEARCISLWIGRARSWRSMVGRQFAPDQCLVSDDHGVGFVLMLDRNMARVVTAVVMADVTRFACALPESIHSARRFA